MEKKLNLENINSEIDKMDITEVENQLEKLSEIRPLPSDIEDGRCFGERIIKQNKKGYGIMGKNIKRFGTLAACLLLTISVGVTAVYGTDILKRFEFFNDDTTVQVRTNQNVSEEEAERLAKEAQEDYDSSDRENLTIETTENIYSSIEEVTENTGVEIVLPSYVPDDFQMGKDISVYDTFNDNYNIYITYNSKEKEDRLFGVTIITQNQPEDSTVVTVTDAVQEGEYETPSGTKYTILDEDGMTIATTSINNIEYSLLFVGVNEKEMHKVINSADLIEYIK